MKRLNVPGPMQWLNLLRFAVITAISLSLGSCSKQPKDDSEKESRREATAKSYSDSEKKLAEREEDENEEVPDSGDVGEDCVQFLRATTAASVSNTSGACPTCPTGDAGPEVLKMDDVKVDQALPTGSDTAQVDVTIHASFRPSHSGTIVGGLTGWMPREQREQYARGETPAGKQTYKVKVTYRRNPHGWTPVEFAPIR